MTEFKAFIAMLERASIGHGLRNDYSPSRTAVMVQTDSHGDESPSEGGEFTETEFSSDDATGRLLSVTSYPGEEG